MRIAPEHKPLGYFVAVVSVALATALYVAVILPLFRIPPSMLLFVLPVLVTGYFGSTRQALLATFLSAAVAVYLKVNSQHVIPLSNVGYALHVLLFLLTGTLISVLSGRLKAANAQARAARARLDGALLGGKVGTWSWTAAGDRFAGDANVAKLLSVGSAELQGATLQDLLQRTHPEDAPLLSERWQRALSETGDFEVPEARVFAPDGSLRWVSARGRVDRDLDGAPASMNGIIIDITDRKRVEEELRASAVQLRLITDAMPALISYLDNERRYRFNNKAYETWYGVKPEALHGMSLREFIGDAAYSAVEPYISKAMRGEVTTFEGPLTYPNRETIHIKASYVPHRAEDGTVLGCFVLVEDLTSQKRAADAVRASEARFRTMADQAPVFIWLADVQGRCTWFNKPWTEFTGRQMARDLGTGWLECVHPEDRERVAEDDRRSARERASFTWEYRVRRHDGTYRWVLDHGVPMHDAQGRVSGFIGSCIDITERRQMEETLREADRRKDEFLATLAHELRNPLAPIRQAAKISQSVQATTEQLRWSQQVIERQVQHMALLLDDLLDVSRITRGTLALRRRSLRIVEVIDAAIETARPQIDARRHRLSVHAPDGDIMVNADPLRLAQVLANILTNAAKYTEPGGVIEVRSQRTADEAIVAIKDTGIGIAPESLRHVFEMFSRGRMASQHAEGGLGIGLAISQGLVALHGGRIEAHSDGLGKGSEFAVRLPLSSGNAESARVPQPVVPAAAATRRILIADDNRDAAESLALLLSLEGHDVRTAHDGAAALAEAEAFRPQYALLDIGMPHLNGYEVARALRCRDWGRELVLIAITGWGQEQDRRRSREAGFDHHLTKPVDPELIAKLMQTTALTH